MMRAKPEKRRRLMKAWAEHCGKPPVPRRMATVHDIGAARRA
jgi:hypothetical protein